MRERSSDTSLNTGASSKALAAVRLPLQCASPRPAAYDYPRTGSFGSAGLRPSAVSGAMDCRGKRRPLLSRDRCERVLHLRGIASGCRCMSAHRGRPEVCSQAPVRRFLTYRRHSSVGMIGWPSSRGAVRMTRRTRVPPSSSFSRCDAAFH